VEAHGKGRLKFLDCRSFFLSENEDIDEELMPDSAYPNASGDTPAADPVHRSALRVITWPGKSLFHDCNRCYSGQADECTPHSVGLRQATAVHDLDW